jgi:hypothetical protein
MRGGRSRRSREESDGIRPSDKAFALAAHGASRSLDRAPAEAAKCVLLRANCYAAVESGVRELPSSTLGSPPREAAHGPG